MRKIVLSIATLLLSSTSLAQQDNGEFSTWMKSIGGTMGSMRKHFTAKEADDAAKDAEKVSSLFKNVEAYYAKTSTDDAVKWAHDAQLAANETAEAAKSNDLDKAGESAKKIGETCGPCHTAHREKLEGGGYKMK